MTTLTLYRDEHSQAIVLPQPRQGEIHIRTAAMDDYEFIDALQKTDRRALGFQWESSIIKRIKAETILIAELPARQGVRAVPQPIGYCMFEDRYAKRDDVGIVYQLVVAPGRKRGLVGAALIQAMFERSAYSCKLFCCWCAQDLEANHFWESLGFVPLAFRTGGRGTKKSGPRIHIFWQRRVREGDTQTPYWYPSRTGAGAVGEDRIVLPIPPGTHWTDAKPAVLPGMEKVGEVKALAGEVEEAGEERPRQKRKKKEPAAAVKPANPNAIALGGLRFSPARALEEAKRAEEMKAEQAKSKDEKKTKAREKKKAAEQYDPKLIAAARELCGRYLDAVNDSEEARMLPETWGKYDVSRVIEGPVGLEGMLGRNALAGDAAGPMRALSGAVGGREDDDVIDATFTVRDAA